MCQFELDRMMSISIKEENMRNPLEAVGITDGEAERFLECFFLAYKRYRVVPRSFLSEAVRIINRNGEEMSAFLLEALKEHPIFRLGQTMFTPPEEQIAILRTYNKDWHWGISEEEFLKAENSVPTGFYGSLVTATLVPYLPAGKRGDERYRAAERTFLELLFGASFQHDAIDIPDKFSLSLKFAKGITHPTTRRACLRWEILDLGAQRGACPCCVASSTLSPHAGILAAAALHPQWVKAMDGVNVPYVWMPGYEGRWILSYRNRCFTVRSGKDECSPRIAVPTFYRFL